MSKPKPATNPFRDTPFPGAGVTGGYRAVDGQLVPATETAATTDPVHELGSLRAAADAQDAAEGIAPAKPAKPSKSAKE